MTRGASSVLAALRLAEDHRCSGQSLSDELGVTRAAVWKHVEVLRRRGYVVEGAPGGGYCLTDSPDRLYADEIDPLLETTWLAREIHHFDSTDSTNRVAFDLARDGSRHGTTVIAEQQTAGRGRLGRAFFSPAHRNLYTSIVLRPKLTIVQAPTLILASAIAVAEAVVMTLVADGGLSHDEALTQVEIKWPNDVLLDGLKTSGILMEMSAEATRIGFVILGIGVNLNVARDDFPEEFRARATSLSEHLAGLAGSLPSHPDNIRIDRRAFAARLYAILEQILDIHEAEGFVALRARFDALFRMRGRAIEVLHIDGSRFDGIARGIAADGALEVEDARGRIEHVIAGDVTLTPAGSRRSQEIS